MHERSGGGATRGADAACREFRLAPDAATASIVRRIFQERLAGRGIQGIAEMLTAEGILCPSAHDAAHNPHHGGVAWSKGAVRAILVNQRYAFGAGIAGYEPLVDANDFTRVQELSRGGRSGAADTPGFRRYLFRSLLRCGDCYRLMQGTWNNGEPYYRCRYPGRYAEANDIRHPRNVYLRERLLLEPLNLWLASTCSPGGLGRWPRSALENLHEMRERIRELAERIAVLREAPGAEWAKVYTSLRLRLVYRSGGREVDVRMPLGNGTTVLQGVVSL